MSGKKAYSKPWLTLARQVDRLASYGLVVNNREMAKQFLRHVNYYRFSGYCLAFEDSRHQFRPGTTFEQIRDTCEFDSNLRRLISEALEVVEIDLRTTVAFMFGKTFDAYGHLNPANFNPQFDQNVTHAEWLSKLQTETKRSRERFVKHFRQTSIDFPNIPIWALTELMTFGSLARMIQGMHKRDRQRIAKQYDVSAGVLATTTHHFSFVRNLCAHHCRLWDQVHSIKPELPKEASWRKPAIASNDRLFTTLLLIRKLLDRDDQTRPYSDSWRDEINLLFTNLPNVPDPQKHLGLPTNWQSHPVWC